MTLKKGHLLLILIQTATPIGAAVFLLIMVYLCLLYGGMKLVLTNNIILFYLFFTQYFLFLGQ